MEESSDNKEKLYTSKVLKAASIVSLVILFILFFIYTFKVLLLLVAALLVSVFFRGIAKWIRERIPVSRTWSLVIAMVAVLIVSVATTWAIIPYAQNQFKEVSKQLPNTLEETKKELKKSGWGKSLIAYVEDENWKKRAKGQSTKFFSAALGIFGIFGDIYITLFMGLMLMMNPQSYIDGILSLLPKSKRERGEEVIFTLDNALRNWLAGKLLSMLIVAVFTWLGLWILGIPVALLLGIFAGFLAFIPNFGPLIAMLLGLLVAASQGMYSMLWTALIYMGVQLVESNLITPYIQQRMISLPMAMIIIAQLVLGVFTGALGLILATPVFAIVLVVVKMLYVEDVLDDHSFKLAPQKSNKEE